MNRKQRAKYDSLNHISRSLLSGSFQRMIFSVHEDPLEEYKLWCARVTRRLGGRAPGNWRTRRGIKKRQRWLVRNIGY